MTRNGPRAVGVLRRENSTHFRRPGLIPTGILRPPTFWCTKRTGY